MVASTTNHNCIKGETMKKKLLAVAIAGALALPFVAQAETQIVGRMHLSVDYLDADNPTVDEDSALNVLSNSSWILFRGSEDLGNGLRAVWQIDNGFRADSGGGDWANRNTFAGLAGAFGEVRVGRHDHPLKAIGRRTDLFGDQVGDSRNLLDDITGGGRLNNSVLYVSPDVGGIQGSLQYSTNVTGAATLDDDTDAWSANLTWSQGPIWVGAGYLQLNNPADGERDPRSWRLGARVSWDAFVFTALYNRERPAVGDDDVDVWGLGAAYTMGNNTLKAQWYQRDDDAANSDADMWAIGVDHRLSKRTSVYAAYAQTDNDPGVDFVSYAGGHGGLTPATETAPGQKPRAFSVGLIHTF
jgi:predicted porin